MSAPTVLARALQAYTEAPASRSASHLADYSFRFDTAAAAVPSLPDDAGEWTLAQTLAELRRRRTTVERTSRGLRVRHAHRVPQLAEAVGRHERGVSAWLDLGGATAPALGWDDETDLLVRWLDAQSVPSGPVALRPGVSVTDWPRFAESVSGRFAEGPDAPCADGLRRDLRDLFGSAEPVRVRPIRPAVRSRAA